MKSKKHIRRNLSFAAEKTVWKIIQKAGFDPIEDMGIIIKYAPENLSAKIASFFSMEFYVLQLCKAELVLVPFSAMATLKKESFTDPLFFNKIR